MKSYNPNIIRNRRAISEIVGYVLLIVIAVSISLLVYTWLKGYLPGQEKTCPEGASLGIEDYSCLNGDLTITLKNNGLFTLDGFIIRASNQTKGRAVYYLNISSSKDIEHYFNGGSKPLSSEEEETFVFDYRRYGLIKQLEIQPFKIDGESVLCKDAVISQALQNCGPEINT